MFCFLHLRGMKNKFAIINFVLSASVLFAILFQSAHSFEHLAKQFSEKHCDHKYNPYKNEINHSHHGLEKCFVCEFTFSPFTAADSFLFSFVKPTFTTLYSVAFLNEAPDFFKGSLFSLRGPPTV